MKHFLLIVCITISLTPIAAAQAEATMQAVYLYNLSDFDGTVSFSQAPVVIDDDREEAYVLYQGVVHVFNDSGMKVYSFSAMESDFDQSRDVAVLPEGDILVLSHIFGGYKITRRNYRGNPTGKIELKDLPPNLSAFRPNRMIYKGGLLYLANMSSLQIVVTDTDGRFKHDYDLLPMLDTKEKGEGDVEMSSFSVDQKGEILFTCSVLFRAYVLSPEGKLREFGQSGSLPGKFNVVAGIASDGQGNYLVVDQLKSAVQVFDENFTFLFIFGGRGLKPGKLIMPDYIAVSRSNLLYVSSSIGGISVFRLLY